MVAKDSFQPAWCGTFTHGNNRCGHRAVGYQHYPDGTTEYRCAGHRQPSDIPIDQPPPVRDRPPAD